MVSKKYKLLKKYPSLPSTWEEGMIVGVGDRHWGFSPESLKYYHRIIGNDEVENNPEFWEKVKEYEVLSFKYDDIIFNYNPKADNACSWKSSVGDWFWRSLPNDAKILSIKRLSDGEIFTIGDAIQLQMNKNTWWEGTDCILSKIVAKKDRLVFYIDQGDLKNHKYTYDLDNWRKAKTPLFVTEDGVDVFENDRVYLIRNYNDPSNMDLYVVNEWKSYLGNKGKPISKHIAFSKKEAAEKYMDENKPRYSKKEIEDILILYYLLF